MKVEYFGKNLFTILANKLIHEENPDSSEENLDISEDKPDISEDKPDISEDKPDISEDKPDISEKSLSSAEENPKYPDSIDDISRSVLMLSYAYRLTFKESFCQVLPLLMRAKGNAIIYVRCFAEASYKEYSPLKFLIVCSFISEIFLFLSKHLVSKRKRSFVKLTTKAFNDAFQPIFEKDFPQNGWTDLQNEASKIANGFSFLEPYMNSETSHVTASQVASAILTDDVVKNQNHPTDVGMSGIISQKIVNPSSLHYDPKSQVLVNIIEVPVLSADGLPTNQTAYVTQNLVCTPVLPVSFGTVDQSAELEYMLQVSDEQNEAVTFLDQPLGSETSYEVIEAVEPSSTEPHVQENLTARSYKNELQPSFQTVKLTEDGKNEPCAPDNTVISEQELIAGEEQFWKECFPCAADNSIISEQELIAGEEQFWEECYPCAADNAISEQELIAGEEQFRRKNVSSDFEDESVQRVKKTENLESESCIADNEILSKLELGDADKKLLKNYFAFPSKTEPKCDKVTEYSQGLEENNDCRSKTYSKADNVDPESETILKEQNVIDPDKVTTANEENALASGKTVNVSENLSETFHQTQSTALQALPRVEAVSSQENDAEQVHEIEINFQTDENDLSAKLLHLNLGGKEFLVRMRADMTLIFKYNGQIPNNKRPQTLL